MTHSHLPVLPRVQSWSRWRNIELAFQVSFRKIKHTVWQNGVEYGDGEQLGPCWSPVVCSIWVNRIFVRVSKKNKKGQLKSSFQHPQEMGSVSIKYGCCLCRFSATTSMDVIYLGPRQSPQSHPTPIFLISILLWLTSPVIFTSYKILSCFSFKAQFRWALWTLSN